MDSRGLDGPDDAAFIKRGVINTGATFSYIRFVELILNLVTHSP
jgi:hypothetical protein